LIAITPRIELWDLDEANTEELAAHGVTVEILDQVVENQPRDRMVEKERMTHGGVVVA
jgi:hypothetical protein